MHEIRINVVFDNYFWKPHKLSRTINKQARRGLDRFWRREREKNKCNVDSNNSKGTRSPTKIWLFSHHIQKMMIILKRNRSKMRRSAKHQYNDENLWYCSRQEGRFYRLNSSFKFSQFHFLNFEFHAVSDSFLKILENLIFNLI